MSEPVTPPNGSEANAYDILPELGAAFDDEGIKYRVLGGMAATLVSTAGAVDLDERIIEAGDDTFKSTVRDNGTVRDVDVLIITENEDVMARANEIGTSVLESRLVLGGFRFKDHAEHMSSGFGLTRRLLDFTTERTIDEHGDTFYVAHPIVHPVSWETYRPWKARTQDGGEFTTINPALSAAAYSIRSLGGIRPRNQSDIDSMDGNLATIIPDYQDYRAEVAGEWLAMRQKMDEVSLKDFADQIELMHPVQAADTILFMGRRGLIKFLDAQQWAVDIAQGKGPVGERLAPILDRIAGEDKSPNAA